MDSMDKKSPLLCQTGKNQLHNKWFAEKILWDVGPVFQISQEVQLLSSWKIPEWLIGYLTCIELWHSKLFHSNFFNVFSVVLELCLFGCSICSVLVFNQSINQSINQSLFIWLSRTFPTSQIATKTPPRRFYWELFCIQIVSSRILLGGFTKNPFIFKGVSYKYHEGGTAYFI